VLALIAEIPVVVCPFAPLDDIRLIVTGIRSPEFEWYVSLPPLFFFFLQTRVWTDADSSLCFLTDAWNFVRFITSLSLLVGG